MHEHINHALHCEALNSIFEEIAAYWSMYEPLFCHPGSFKICLGAHTNFAVWWGVSVSLNYSAIENLPSNRNIQPQVSTAMSYVGMFMHVAYMPLTPLSTKCLHGCPEPVNGSCLLFCTSPPRNHWALCFHTWAGQVQLGLAKPQLGPVNSAGVELNSEHHLPLCRSTAPMVALHLQAIKHNNGHLKKKELFEKTGVCMFLFFVVVVPLCHEGEYGFLARCCCGKWLFS